MGMIDGAAKSGGVKLNPLLQKTEDKIEATVKPEMRDIYTKIVTRAIQFTTSDKAQEMLFGELAKSKDPVSDVALGSVGIMIILYQKSKGTMPIEIMPAAGMTLVLQGLAFVEPLTGQKVQPQDVDRALELFMANLLPKIGITPEMIQTAQKNAVQASQNKQLMSQYQAASGGAK